jgi:hypothetical protein
MQQISLGSVNYKSFPGRLRLRDYVLLALNLIGAIIYLRRSSLSWAIPQEKGLHSQTGEPFVWAAAAIPIFAIFFAVNAIWGGIILVRRRWPSGYLWLLTALIWLLAVVIDFAHH